MDPNRIFNDNIELSNSTNTQTWVYKTIDISSSLPVWNRPTNDPAGIYQISLGRESTFIQNSIEKSFAKSASMSFVENCPPVPRS